MDVNEFLIGGIAGGVVLLMVGYCLLKRRGNNQSKDGFAPLKQVSKVNSELETVSKLVNLHLTAYFSKSLLAS